MPVLETKGAASAQGYGLTTSRPQGNFIEDVFSTWLYTGNGENQGIPNGIQLGAGATSPGWIAALPSVGGQEIGRDSSNNVYVCADNNLIKYNSVGSLLWQNTFNNSGALRSIAVTGAGDSYIFGSQNSPSGFGIIKYNTSGALQWQRTLETSFGAAAEMDIALDGSENVYVCGSYTASSGDHTLGLVAKYNSSGTIQWQRQLARGFSSSDAARANGIAVDSVGNVYVCGSSRVFDSDEYGLTIIKYNTNGSVQWQQRITPTATSNVAWYGIAVSADGADIYVGGGNGSTGWHLAKYNSSGVLQWQRGVNTPSNADSIRSITVDSSNNVYVVGRLSTSPESYGIFKYNSSGTLQWQRALSTGSSTTPRTIITDSSGNVLVGGQISFFASGAIFAKLPPDGSGSGAYIVGAQTFTYSATTYTTTTPTLTGSAGVLGSSTSTLTGATSSFTSSAASLTSNTTALIEGGSGSGLVWMKSRSGATDHALYDTARGATFDIASNTNTAQTTQSTGLTGFLANGFSIGSLATINTNTATYASWTFREQPKFFDVVTYTGNGANRTIAHNLGSVPGCIIVKRTDTTADWQVYHRSLANTQYMVLNTTSIVATDATRWNSTTPTDTVFSLGTDASVNANGGTYVAYLFAHDAGGFGATGADNVISCGSYTGNGSTTGPVVTLGYEPQWLLIKRTSGGSGDWNLIDNMRGFTVGAGDAVLNPNLNAAESTGTFVAPTATGFQIETTAFGFNSNGSNYIYIAIRRGPMRTPTTGTSVFGLNARTGTGVNATVTGGQTDDAVLIKNRGSSVSSFLFSSRLTNTGYLVTSSTAAEVTAGTTILQANPWDVMDGVKVGTTSPITNASANTFINYLFRRAPGFFDVVCYTGTGANRTVTHNLGAVPELMIVKGRSGATDWQVYSSALANTEYLVLNTTAAKATGATRWNSTTPTSSVFSLGTATEVNTSAATYAAYLFATVGGVSKVGTYTGTGATQVVNCGFAAGARFVLIKRTDSTGDWYVWDTARGIIAGNDPYLRLNLLTAEVTGTDWVDTAASGFELSNAGGNLVNTNGASYIFLSVA